MTKADRKCTGIWFPIAIWESRNFRLLEKFIIAEVDSLDKEGKGCWASNGYLAGLSGTSEKTISRCINDLKKRGVLKIWEDGGTKRRMAVTKEGWTKCLTPPQNVQGGGQNVQGGGQNVQGGGQNVQQYNNNTVINNPTPSGLMAEFKTMYETMRQEKLEKKTGLKVSTEMDKTEIKYLLDFMMEIKDLGYAVKLFSQFFDDKVSSVFQWAKTTDYSFKAFNHKKTELIAATPRPKVRPACPECGDLGGHLSTCSVSINLAEAKKKRHEDIIAGRALIAEKKLSESLLKRKRRIM